MSEEYTKLKKDHSFIELDGTLPKEEIHSIIKQKVQELLDSGAVE